MRKATQPPEAAKAPSARNLWATVPAGPDNVAQSKPSNISMLRTSCPERLGVFLSLSQEYYED